jgi:hypothetical protein
MVFSLLPVSVDTSSLPEFDAPVWTESHRVITGLIRWVQYGGEVMGLVGKQVRVAHSEHPEVLLTADGSEVFLLHAKPVQGETQYLPRTRMD